MTASGRRTDRFILDSNIHPDRVWRPTIQAWGYATEVAYAGFTEWAAERDDLYGLGDTPGELGFEADSNGSDHDFAVVVVPVRACASSMWPRELELGACVSW